MMQDNTWYAIRNQSLAVAARNAGFDLAIYEEYSKDVKEELKKRTISQEMLDLRRAFLDTTGTDLSEITHGIYVISLSAPLTIEYEEDKRSEIIYIGIGNLRWRIFNHFKLSLFDFMQSLSGANFDFRFARPKMPYFPNYYRHVEFKMLDRFKSLKGRFPLLNSNAGANKNIRPDDEWWSTPLSGAGKKRRWALRALPGSGFASLD